MGTWLCWGPFSLTPPDCQAQQSLPSSTQLALLLSSVPPTAHCIRFCIRANKTNVPSYNFHVWFRRHFKIPEPQVHCFQVTNPPGEALRNWAKCSTSWSPSLFVTKSGTCLSFYLVVKHQHGKTDSLVCILNK